MSVIKQVAELVDAYLLPVITNIVTQYYLRTPVVYSTDNAFAAVLGDGTVITWGSRGDGGSSSAVQSKLKNIRSICSTEYAFAATTNSGTVITWGDHGSGDGTTQPVAERTGVAGRSRGGALDTHVRGQSFVLACLCCAVGRR